MFDFDNVGFSKTVGDCKFLTCADCEIGPIGYQGSKNRKHFSVSLGLKNGLIFGLGLR